MKNIFEMTDNEVIDELSSRNIFVKQQYVAIIPERGHESNGFIFDEIPIRKALEIMRIRNQTDHILHPDPFSKDA